MSAATRITQQVRELALVVYGATGFTGKFVCEYIAQGQRQGKGPRVAWGVAGRSMEKLETLVRGLDAKGLPRPDQMIVADASNDSSLDDMAARAQLVMNCTGPYRFLGEQVVASCIRQGTDYIDLCGEPEFMDKMLLMYNDEAKEKGVLILHACAFDSVPADIGTIYTTQVFNQGGGSPSTGGGGTISSIESFLTLDSGGRGLHGHVTTFEAAVHGFGQVKELIKLRREIKQRYPYDEKKVRIGPPPQAKAGPFYEPRLNKYCFRFPGSDASVVRSSQRQIVLNNLFPSNPPSYLPYYAAYFTVPSVFWATVVGMVGGVFTFLAKYDWGRKLLLRYPTFFTMGAFTADGPSDEVLASTSFSITFFAKGYSSSASPTAATADPENQQDRRPLLATTPDKFVTTRVTGPEPGYVATPIIFVELAHCLLEERTSLPVQGGVYTPGVVFCKGSTLIDRLQKAGIDFTVLQP